MNGAWFSTFSGTVNFDQDATQVVNVDPNQIQAGSFRPDDGNLDSFVGADAIGNWTLSISDSAGGRLLQHSADGEFLVGFHHQGA